MKLSDDKTKDTLLKAGAVGALLFYLNKLNEDRKKDNAETNIANTPAAAQAATIKTLLRPGGYMWMRHIFGLKIDEIMRVAEQITDLNAVKTEYENLLIDEKASFHDDLQSSLGPELYQKFLSLGTKGKTGSWYYKKESKQDVPANMWVVTKASANIRKTPVLQHRVLINDNIVKTVAKGRIVGSSTGKFAYDEVNKVLFIEFWTLSKKDKKRLTYFVAKSQIEFYGKVELAARQKKEGNLPFELLEGIEGIDQQQEVVTTSSAPIFNEKFEQVGIAPKNTTIGFPIMTLNTGKGKHIQIKTVQGLVRWISADLAEIRDRQF